MIALLRSTLALVLTVLVCWAVAPSADAAPRPAAAECERLDLDDDAAVRASADAVTDVFVGKVRAVERRVYVGGGEGQVDQTDGPQGDQDPRMVRWVQQVDVQVQYRGTVEEGGRVAVVTDAMRDGGFGPLTDEGMYLFFVTGDKGTDRLTAEACSGTQMLAGGLGSSLRNRLEEILVETDAPAAPDYTLMTPDDGARSTPALGRLVAPGAAVALIGVLGLLLLSRIGSRRT